MSRQALALVVAVVLLTGAGSLAASADPMTVLGSVRVAARPVEEALVIAFNISDFSTQQTFTARDGFFQLPPLKSGVYRILAVKQGFAPAIATVLPSRKGRRVDLKIELSKELTSTARDQIWQIRRSLPSDVLRELDHVVAQVDGVRSGRLQGDVTSVAGFDANNSSSSIAQTQVGLRGEFGDGWRVDVKGQVEKEGNDRIEVLSLGESEGRGVVMEIGSSPNHGYRVASSRISWGLNDPDSSAALESHQVEWHRYDTRLKLRYLDQENLFASAGLDSRTVDFTGTTRLFDATRSSLDVIVKFEQQTPSSAVLEPYRAAAMSASGHQNLGRRFDVRYGLHTRVDGAGSVEYAPETAAFMKFGTTAVGVSGIYKVPGDAPMAVVTRTSRLNDAADIASRYRYTFSFASGSEENRVSATLTVAEIDSVIRFVFDDRFSQAGDGLYAQPGDVHRDVTLAFRRAFGRQLVVDVVSSAGRMDDALDGNGEAKTYLTTSVQSFYRRTGTSLNVGYRTIDQPFEEQLLLGSDAERLNVRVGQRIYAPIDVRLLFGFDLGRSSREEFVADALETRLVGGLSFAF